MAANLRHQTDERRRDLASGAAAREKACRFGYRLRQYGANREIAGLQDSSIPIIRVLNIGVREMNGLVGTGSTTKGKDLEAGECGSGVGQVLPLKPANVGIERSMIVVENGNSTGRLEIPKAPPAAPARTAMLLCMRRLSLSGLPAKLRKAKSSPLLTAASAALFAISAMFPGSNDPMAFACRPRSELSRIARLVRSRSYTARSKAC